MTKLVCPPGQVRNSYTKSCREKKNKRRSSRQKTRKSGAKLLVKNLRINYTMVRFEENKPIEEALAGKSHDIAGFIKNKKYYFCPEYKGETLIQSEERIFTDVLKTSKKLGQWIVFFGSPHNLPKSNQPSGWDVYLSEKKLVAISEF